MRRVVVISRCRGNWLQRLRFRAYARLAVRDCLMRGEAPVAAHLLYGHRVILRDWVDAERAMGMEAGQAWIAVADAVAVYADYGVSEGMSADVSAANAANVPVLYRYILGPAPEDQSGDLFRNYGGLM